MPYAVTLPLDDAAATCVREIRYALASYIGATNPTRLAYSPHVTLTVLADAAPVAEIEEAVFGIANQWTALSLNLAGFGVFPGAAPVIWIAPVVKTDLLAVHAELYRALAAFSVDPHYRPGGWVPHVTLSQEGSASSGAMIDCASLAWKGPTQARLERVELVRFLPVEVLRTQALRSVI